MTRTSLALPALLALLTLLAVACVHGTPGGKFSPAISPGGAHVTYRVLGDRAARSGELFAADDVGVTIISDVLVHVPWTKLVYLRVPGRGTYYDTPEKHGQSSELKSQLAQLSRFPQGLSGPLLAEVLAILKQDALVQLP